MEAIKIDDNTFTLKLDFGRAVTYTVDMLVKQYSKLKEDKVSFDKRQADTKVRLDSIASAARSVGIIIPEE